MTNARSQRRISTRSLKLSPITQVRLTTGRVGSARKRRSTLLLQMAGAAFGDAATNAELMRICPVQTSFVATDQILMGKSASAPTPAFSRGPQATASTCEPWLCSDDRNEGRAAWVPTWMLPSRFICSDWASRWAAARSPVPSAATICAIGLFPLISPDPLATNACARWALAASPSCIAMKSSFTPC